MSFLAVGSEEPKECGPKLVVQDRGTSSLFVSAKHSRNDHEPLSFYRP